MKSINKPKNVATLLIVFTMIMNCFLRPGMKRINLNRRSNLNVRKTEMLLLKPVLIFRSSYTLDRFNNNNQKDVNYWKKLKSRTLSTQWQSRICSTRLWCTGEDHEPKFSKTFQWQTQTWTPDCCIRRVAWAIWVDYGAQQPYSPCWGVCK